MMNACYLQASPYRSRLRLQRNAGRVPLSPQFLHWSARPDRDFSKVGLIPHPVESPANGRMITKRRGTAAMSNLGAGTHKLFQKVGEHHAL
jgi:hypothetical protein